MVSTIKILKDKLANATQDGAVTLHRYIHFLVSAEKLQAECTDPVASKVYEDVMAILDKSIRDGDGLALEHAVGDVESKFFGKFETPEQTQAFNTIMRLAEAGTHTPISYDDAMAYYANDSKRQAIIAREYPKLVKLFPTGEEVYLWNYVFFDNINEQIYSDHVYSLEGALGELRFLVNRLSEDESISAVLIRNDRVRYWMAVDKMDFENDEDEEDDDEDFDEENED